MIAVDSGVIVAAFASWHESHAPARRAVLARPTGVGHALIEAYSVLTRLPAPHRVAGALVTEFIETMFPGPVLVLDGSAVAQFVARLPPWSISGGAVYDALVGATVAEAGGSLLTLDRRALPIYERVGCAARVLD